MDMMSRLEVEEGDSVETRQSMAKAAMAMCLVCKCCMQCNILSCALKYV